MTKPKVFRCEHPMGRYLIVRDILFFHRLADLIGSQGKWKEKREAFAQQGDSLG